MSIAKAITTRVPGKARLRSARESGYELAARASRALRARRDGATPAIRSPGDDRGGNEVESYWGRHTVNTLRLWTPRASAKQLEWRFEKYPLFREFSGLWGDHGGQVVLDYGCGPGNDVVGLALHSGARRIIGVDVSRKALEMAADRIALHGVDPARTELVLSDEQKAEVPLADASVDYFQSQGVLHHTSAPELLLAELRRVLVPGGRGTIMVYNRDSIWFHLYSGYELRFGDEAFAGLEPEEAFKRSTDGVDCPISRCYRGPGFAALCESAGFEVEYLGGYLSDLELDTLRRSWARAIIDDQLESEHRDFLRSLTFDPSGYPMYDGMHAGIGGTYRVRRPED